MIGELLGHYHIRSSLGAGGMGEVFRATDINLGRDVALKVLPAEMASNPDRLERFKREAKALAALDHSSVVGVYSVEESNGIHFLTMQLVEGQTLESLIVPGGMEVALILDIAMALADALVAAHAKGIIHRDLKPANLMLTREGRLKVLDFGLAKMTSSPGGEESDPELATDMKTREGVVMGTMPYMSPEQVRGESVDAGTDIFSCGVILYELATGRRPFQGRSSPELASAILRDAPRAAAELRPGLPDGLLRILDRCLEKTAANRFSAADLQDALRSALTDPKGARSEAPTLRKSGGSDEPTGKVLAPGTTFGGYLAIGLAILVLSAVGFSAYRHFKRTRQIKSIAVMPFINESGNAEVEYLSDGMTETLINSLSRLTDLNVKARSTVFRYKGKETNARTLGGELDVQAILNGRVVQRGEQLTLSLELVDAQTENVIWSESYHRKQADLVLLQSEIARDVSSKLKSKLSGADVARVEKNYTTNVEAFQLFLKGRFYGSKRTAKDAQTSIEFFQQAVAVDPNYALAYAGLAESNWFLALYSYPQVLEAVPKARKLALKALELDNSLAEPHSILGVICFNYDRDFECMERETKLAIELNPKYSEGHRRYGLLLQSLGRFEEARLAYQRSLEIDPLSPVTNFESAQLLFFSGKYEESETLSRKNVELDPNFWYARLQLFYVDRMKRDYASAVEELARVQDARGEPDAAKLIRESFVGGDWQGFLRKITAQRKRLKFYPYFVATFLAELGEKDEAFATLNEADETKDQHTSWMKVDPYMNPLREDPRFQELLRRSGFP